MDLDATLRTHGHRVTRPRRLVWDVLTAADGHLNAVEVTERVQARDRSVNPSSVYRTLTLFTDLGLARESRLGGAATWEQSHEDAVVHLVCDVCGRVHHHPIGGLEQLRRDLAGYRDFVADTIDVRVSGRCLTCH